MTVAMRAHGCRWSAVLTTVVTTAVAATLSGPAVATTPSPAPLDPAAVTPDRVVILQTDTAADATSGALRDAAEGLGVTVRHTFGALHALSVQVPAGSDVTATAARLATLPGVARVEPAVRRSFTAIPDDPQFASQRSYLDAVTAPAAWSTQLGSSAVTIAVIDSGVDVRHPDLAGKITKTYNAVTRTSSVTDTVGHGTFVAGVAAARTDNGIGVAGAGYNTSIMAVKVADDYGDIAVDDEVAGIRWAADHGANVINLSLSGPDSSQAEGAAIAYAQAKGVVVVAAAGNENSTTPDYPAAYPGVIAVAATNTATGRRASFSNHGPWVSLAAPGVNVVSTTPTAGSEFFPGRSGYARGDGTSFASPLVAGAAALLRAQNPTASVAAIRTALVASAHGYAGNDVGHGQVDFALALQHIAPSSVPGGVSANGTSGDIQLSASSTAPKVLFQIDGQPYGTPVAVSGGTASVTWSSYGYAQGQHTISAVDCSTYNDCNTVSRSTANPVELANATPSATAPSRVSGPGEIDATVPGGGLRLLVDGGEAGFVAAPDTGGQYRFTVNGSQVSDGQHAVSVQSCTTSHSRCDGPTSATTQVTFDSLHPTLGVPSHAAISPAGYSSATLAVDLTGADSAHVDVIDATGTVRRSESLPVSATSWTFRGIDANGQPLPDGQYRIALYAGSSNRAGLAERSVSVDTVAPHLGAVTGANTVFYPVRDGYRDTFAPTAALPDGGTLSLVITTATGQPVRTITAARPVSSRASLAWNGLSDAGRLQRSGTYLWHYTVSDDAGNTTRSATYRVTLSTKRLIRQTVSLTRNAHTGQARGSARCAGKTSSRYRHGIHLVNRCTASSEEVSYANYTIALPAALSYQQLRFEVYGRSARKSQLIGLVARNDGGLEVPGATKISKGKARWHTIAVASASGRISHGKVHVAVVLTPHYSGANDFDARSVRVKVTLTQLR